MIDEIDRKIITALTQDGRYSYTELAAKLGVEGITVAKRVARMLKDDVILISAVPNPVKMGYSVMVCIALEVRLSGLEEVCRRLVAMRNVSAVSTLFGKYDVMLFAEYRDVDALHQAVMRDIPAIEGVKAIHPFMISRDKTRREGSLDFSAGADNRPVPIDKIDENLIEELRINGRARFALLAQKYGISPATVSRRVKALIENEVIQITVLANPIKLVQRTLAFLFLQTELKAIDKIYDRLSGMPQVKSLMVLMNGYNILTVVVLPDPQSLSRFIVDKIASIEGVLNIDTLIRSEIKKRTYLKADIDDILR
jgi:DNA-binding Lrp family transcriptional regulator